MRNILKLAKLIGARKLEERTTIHRGASFLGSIDVGVRSNGGSYKEVRSR